MSEINIPKGYGTIFSHMGWQLITANNSKQKKLKDKYGMEFDPDGIGCIDGRKVIACTKKFGNIGDALYVTLKDGKGFHAIIGDFKNENDSHCNEWGHNDGKCVVEFIVNKNGGWKGYNGEKTAVSVLSFLKNNPVVKIKNLQLNYLSK